MAPLNVSGSLLTRQCLHEKTLAENLITHCRLSDNEWLLPVTSGRQKGKKVHIPRQ
ncbi:hypothetical protein [Providencia stuartii]|uniref:hypothetical protein n=1 Tax=Providencia stuartii TaxID=588 RepID=UPI0028C1684B|nr:hypothetical protein [Providencia stuartii]MDT7052041.1 hypothetical protein [Providencia stuartii]